MWIASLALGVSTSIVVESELDPLNKHLEAPGCRLEEWTLYVPDWNSRGQTKSHGRDYCKKKKGAIRDPSASTNSIAFQLGPVSVKENMPWSLRRLLQFCRFSLAVVLTTLWLQSIKFISPPSDNFCSVAI